MSIMEKIKGFIVILAGALIIGCVVYGASLNTRRIEMDNQISVSDEIYDLAKTVLKPDYIKESHFDEYDVVLYYGNKPVTYSFASRKQQYTFRVMLHYRMMKNK